MLSKEDFAVITALAKRGVYQKDIAEELGVSPKTVGRALKRGAAPKRERAKRGSKLEPYHEQVNQLLAEGVWNAVVILREIQAAGYTGGATVLRAYIAPKRALRAGRATVRFETPPGKQLQSDWGQIRTLVGGQEVKVHFIVNVLGFSRRFHFWCTDSEDAEHTYEGLVRSFEYFGGVPADVLVDNQRAAVVSHRPDDGARFNERFVDLAGHYGFTPRACRPYRARTKGKIERMVGYVKQHFFVRYRAFDSWAHLNQLAEAWLRDEADQRLHGTVNEVVAARFELEAPVLTALPATRYDTAYRESREVSWDSYIEVRGRRYSVPSELVGRSVTIRLALDNTCRVLDGECLVAQFTLVTDGHDWVTTPGHHGPLWEQTLGVEQRSLAIYDEVAAWN